MNTDYEIDSICNWIAWSVGDRGVVIGISGGIDSAVVAALAVRALGVDKVYALLLPNGVAGVSDLAILDELCISTFKVHNISKEVYLISKSLGITATRGTIGNIQARLRMVHLYAHANHLGYRVIGTTNKSELAVGYFTKHGDGGVDLEPIADYYKGEVYELARALGIPSSSIDRPPSAELWSGQTDEEELGMTYPVLDEVLKANTVDKAVDKMILASEHKRHMPPIFMRS